MSSLSEATRTVVDAGWLQFWHSHYPAKPSALPPPHRGGDRQRKKPSRGARAGAMQATRAYTRAQPTPAAEPTRPKPPQLPRTHPVSPLRGGHFTFSPERPLHLLQPPACLPCRNKLGRTARLLFLSRDLSPRSRNLWSVVAGTIPARGAVGSR